MGTWPYLGPLPYSKNSFHNMHIWVIENPHAIVSDHFQHHLSLNVSAGIIDEPLILPNQMMIISIWGFIHNDPDIFLEDVPL